MSNSTTHQADDQKNPDALEREVNQARARMSQTVDALGTRLSPGELIDQFIGTAREHGGELTRNFGGQVKQNPVPALLTTVGIAWMMAGSNSSADSAMNFNGGNSSSDESWSRSEASGDSSSIGQTVKSKLEAGKDKLAAGKDKLAEGKESAADRIDSVKSSASDQAAAARENAKQRASELQRNMQQFMHEQPLIAGTLGMALGAALGALVPPTEAEDRMVGSASDQATERAKQLAAEQYERGREKAKQTAQKVKETVREEASTTATDYA